MLMLDECKCDIPGPTSHFLHLKMYVNSVSLLYFYNLFYILSAQIDGPCENCVPVEQCSTLESASNANLKYFLKKDSCDPNMVVSNPGSLSTSRRDFICCPIDSPSTPGTQASESVNRGSNNVERASQNRISNGPQDVKPKIMYDKEQCQAVIRRPPDPNTGCCGRETDDDKTVGSGNILNTTTKSTNSSSRKNQHIAQAPTPNWKNYFLGRTTSHPRLPRASNNNTNVTIDNRIAGGSIPEIDQFPWTVLLTARFMDNQGKITAFNCGGSLISSRYVLTAGHCVSDEDSILQGVDINLAEFDKRTFPIDCAANSGERKCVRNIAMTAENVIIHPEFDSTLLQSDIALLRLNADAPYNDFIRPICLPPFDIDTRKLKNLPLVVAGWGRNGPYETNVKRYTVVNLVPQNECRSHYRYLNRRHLCAAGMSGEDPCKGDSGGPLMMLYEGKYFVSGVVSGKRKDSPCGTSVPSLYTNVYHYLDWIAAVILN